MRFRLLVISLLICLSSAAQTHDFTGKILDERNMPLPLAEVVASKKTSVKLKALTANDGSFTINIEAKGKYHISISHPGYEAYEDSIIVGDTIVNLGVIHLVPAIHMLEEVKIVEKVLAMVQKDDTMEYNAGAYKVNPDADAADLVKKMPAIELNDKKITAQGESVVKVLVDGKPFFGDDPYASLKNLPAEVIDKVQVYNEKTDQERFTGFSEGPTSKTINIITKRDKRKGVFGTVYAGTGSGLSPDVINGSAGDDNTKYGTGATLNNFGGDRRITLTAQANNVNSQNFTDQAATGGGSAGTSITNAGGINYSDKLGKKIDFTGSYFFNSTNNSISHLTTRDYVSSTDSGQVYKENSPSTSKSYGHRASFRINYVADSMNTVLWMPQFSVNNSNGYTARQGNTTIGADPINETINTNDNSRTGLTLGSNLLLSHKFRKKGRTISLSVNANNNGNEGHTIQIDTNIYYKSTNLNDTTNQRVLQKQNTSNLQSDAIYTEPAGEHGRLKLQYGVTYAPAQSEKNNFNLVGGSYSPLADTALSNTFDSKNIAHRAGVSYQYQVKRYEFSLGANYQFSTLINHQELPYVSDFYRQFQNLLPVANLQFKFSKTKNLHLNYSTATQAPSITQLQNVINNTDPLHLTTGDPALRQPYSHSLTIRYNAVSNDTKNNFSASISGRYTRQYIASHSFITTRDTTVEGISLPPGAQLTLPVNIADGAASVNANLSYSMPLSFIKCRLNVNTSTGINRTPAIINYSLNYQDNKNASMSIAVNSNISDNVDFNISSNTGLTASENSLNQQPGSTYISENIAGTLNLILWRGIVFNTVINYRSNAGLSAGYNQDYMLWNVSIGKKVFKKHQGDIRLTVFDILNRNNNISRSFTETYVQDMQSNILQRYAMLVFTYKIREFRK